MPCYQYKGKKYTAIELLKYIKSNENSFLSENNLPGGKWRYEVPDGKNINPISSLKRKEIEGREYIIDKLNNLVNDPELFKAYPELNDLDVVLYNFEHPNYISGEFRSKIKSDYFKMNASITLWNIKYSNDKLPESKVSTLFHEIQHAIQDYEGFAQGGNEGTVSMKDRPDNPKWAEWNSEQNQAKIKEYKSIIETKEYLNERDESNKLFSEEFDPVIDKLNEERTRENNKEISDKVQAVFDEFYKLSAQKFPTLTKADEISKDMIYHEPSKKISGQDIYRRLAGEVESRNVQTRMNMTPEERLNTLLSETEDVSREDQIVLMDGLGVSNLENLSLGENKPMEYLKSKDIETGKPVTMTYLKNTEKAPYLGSRFGQDVEPSGFYFIQKEHEFPPSKGWIEGQITLNNPLVIPITDETMISYKNDLSKKYGGKKNKALTNAIKKDGYDGIITTRDGYLGEMIKFDFEPSKQAEEPITNKIEQQRSEVNTEPSEAQKEAGNYKMGHVRFDGFDISIENPKGSVRSGVDKQGNEWSQVLPADYGYFRGTKGRDKDHVDVFIGNKPEASNIYIIDQIDPNSGKFDEHKVMLGMTSQSQAKQTYLAAFEPGWKGLGKITKTDKQGLKEWFEKGDQKKPFSDNHPQVRFRFAFHGSPHSFDKFSLDKIGTGEGAQAYGWGLYFTDKKSIAEQYADKLKPNSILIGGKTYDEVSSEIGDTPALSWVNIWFNDGYSKDEIIAKLEKEISDAERLESFPWIKPSVEKVLSYIQDKTFKEDNSNRNLYTVKIHGDKTLDELNFLRWDKPLTENQIDQIVESGKTDKLELSKDKDENGKIWLGIKRPNGRISYSNTGENVYKNLNDYEFNSQKNTSLFLLKSGIDGIIYPTEYTTKGTHEEAYNYVVFDENAVQIQEHIRFRIAPRDERFDQLREDLNKVSRFRTASENDLLKSVNETVESNMNESYGIKETPLWERIKKKLNEVKESTQHFKFITEKEFPEVYDKLRQFEAIPDRVKKEAYERVSQIVRPLIKNEEHMRAFERYIVLSDLVHDIEETSLFANKQLPWGYNTIDEIKQDMRNVRAYVMRTPQVLKAIRDRQAMMKEVKKELVANKLLKDNGNDNYFHHQVLAFMEGKANVGVSAKDVRNHKKGWQRSRQGSIALYNTNYVESEFEVMAQSLEQLAIKNMLGEINESINIMPQLIEKAQKEGGSWRDYIPDGYKFWFPKPGTNAYKAASMAEKAVNNLMNDPNNPELQAILAEAEGSMWVIPEPVAKQLDEMKDPEKEMIYAQGLRAMTNKWKQWTLLNPFRAAKYNFNNMSGDLDIVLAYDPKILEKKYAHSAMTEALNEMRGKGMSEDMKEALRYGVITSGLSIQEIPDINKESLFRSVTKGQGNWAKRVFGKTLGSYWSGVTAFTQFRENILRVAAYKFFKEQIKQGKQPFGVSNHDAIQALYASKANPNEIAGKLARELLGDYGNLSQGGQWIRAHSYPFWSWVEVNAPRYYRLLQNTKFEGNSGVIGRVAGVGAKKTAVSVGMLGVRVMLMTGLVMLWNQIMFPDEDDELQKLGDDKLKLIVGRRDDGSIITVKIQGAFSDVLSFFSLEDAVSDIKELKEGESTIGKKAKESGNAFVNKFAQGAMPITRATMELAMGKSLYPDIFNPTNIRDKGEHAARFVSMDKLYNYLTHKPVRSFGKEVSGLLVYDNNPGEAAYYTMREKISEFLKDNDEDGPATEPSDKSNALYYYKKSLKMGDEKGTKFWFDKFRELGGTAKGYKSSMKKGILINSVPKELRGKWFDTLDSEDKEILDLANRWYMETYLKVGIPVNTNE